MPLILAAPYLKKLIASIFAGSLYGWGQNNQAQLGKNRATNTVAERTPELLNTSEWLHISSHQYHSLGVKKDGTLWAWGANNQGQCGTGVAGSTRILIPTQIGTDKDWKEVSAGIEHSGAIKTDGTLWTWGANGLGQLGKGHANSSSADYRPVKVGVATDWKQLSCGNNNSIAVRADGSLYTWGFNYESMLGHGHTGYITQDYSPRQIAGSWQMGFTYFNFMIALQSDGTLWGWGVNSAGQLGLGDTTKRMTPTKVGTDTNWKSITTGAYHCVATKTNGTLWTWGDNGWGQLGKGVANGVPANYSPVQMNAMFTDAQSISLGNQHSLIVTKEGALYVAGKNDFYQLGTGNTTTQPSWTRIGNSSRWKKVFAGYDHSFAFTSGILASWNPSDSHVSLTLSNFNLSTSGASGVAARSTNSKTTGKWYMECTINSIPGSSVLAFGIADKTLALNGFWAAPNTSNRYLFGAFNALPSRYYVGTEATVVPGNVLAKAGDVIGVAFDLDGRKIEFFLNGVKMGEVLQIAAVEYYAYVSDGSSGSTVTSTTNFGDGPFAYAIPAGYLAFSS